MDDFVAILRTAGERSYQAAQALLEDQVPPPRVFVVDERPFERALQKTYELGLAQGRKWTMTLDADVLLRDGAVRALLAHAERMPASYAQIEGRVFDKITGLFRQAGHRVYRTQILGEALGHIPPPGTTIRPESDTLLKLTALGYRSRRVACLVGVHDFEQYYRDLYRKAFVHARKHRSLAPLIVDRCLRHAGHDRDFDVILKGVLDGITSTDRVGIDSRGFEGRGFDEWLISACLSEKTGLTVEELAIGTLHERIRLAVGSVRVPPFDTVDEPAPPRSSRQVLWQQYRERVSERGWWKGTTSSVGSLLKRVGMRMEGL